MREFRGRDFDWSRRGLRYSLELLFVLLAGITACQSALAQQGLCATVSIQIQQKASLERQAFTAELDINNGLTTSPITAVGVNILFSDANGNAVVATSDPNNTSASFFLTPSGLSGINATDGTGTVAPSTTAVMRWLIIPASGTGGTSPSGAVYMVGATLTYTLDGQTQTVNVSPASITVLPQPRLQLDYFLPEYVYADDPFTPQIEPPVPFTLGVRVTNSGGGAANNLTINSAQPKIVDNQQGLLIGFQLLDSYVDDQPAANTLLINFGTVAPQQSRMGRWDMETTLDGQFVSFTAKFTHADSLGGALTSLISGVNTHNLVHDVLVDLPGRDSILDFLAKDGATLSAYESDGPNDSVVDVSSNASLGNLSGGRIPLTFPVATGLVYVQLPDPFQGQLATVSAVRSDGKTLPSANAWFSKTRNSGGNWVYFVNVFDTNTTGQYTLVGGGSTDSSSLAGSVFGDVNADGIRDNGEAGIAGVGVHLHGTTSSATIDLDTITDSSGNYEFGSLAAGTYALSVTAIPQYSDGNATAGTAGGTAAPGSIQAISLAAGAAASGYQFAKIPQTSSAVADFALTNFAISAPSVPIGGSVTLTATLSNLGPASDNANVAFVIPSGVTIKAATASSGSFDSNARTWSLGTLASSATATLSITLQGTTAGNLTISANAVAGTAATDPNLGNNTGSVALSVTTVANITLSQSAPATVNTNGALAYTIGLGNSGQTASATTVTVADTLPAGVTYVSAAAGTGVKTVNCTGTTTLVCTVTLTAGLASNTPNGTSAFTIATTAPAAAGSITNYASVDSTGGTNPPTPGTGCTPSTACASATTTVVAAPPTPVNIGLSLSLSTPVRAGSHSSLGVNLTNAGTTPSATTLTVLNQLPAGMMATSANAASGIASNLASSVSCTNLNVAGALLTCTVTLSGPIDGSSNTSALFYLDMITNTLGTVTDYASTDPTGGTNAPTPGTGCTPSTACASATTTVVAAPPTPVNIGLSLSLSTPVRAGSHSSLGVNLTNAGTTPSATTLTVLNQLPAGMMATSANAASGIASNLASSVSCTNLNVAGALLTCTVTLSGPIDGSSNTSALFYLDMITNTLGTVTDYASTDPTGGTNAPTPGTGCTPRTACASATTTVAAPVDITLSESGPDSVQVDSAYTYTVSFGNSGQQASESKWISLGERFPAGAILMSLENGPNVVASNCGTLPITLTANGGPNYCLIVLKPLPAGSPNGTATLTFHMVAPSTAGTISNYVSIDPSTMSDAPAAGPACVPTTSCAGVVTVVNATAPTPVNLTLAQSGPASTASASAIAYTLSLGNSGQNASGTTVTVDEVLPAGVTLTSVQPGPDVTSVDCGTLPVQGNGATVMSCKLQLSAPLAAGAQTGTAAFTVNATVPSAGGAITNYASVDASGGTNPPVPGTNCIWTNCASATTAVAAPVDITLSESGPDSVQVDSAYTYTVSFGNSGQQASESKWISLGERFPAGAILMSLENGPNVVASNCGTLPITLTANGGPNYCLIVLKPLPAGSPNGTATLTFHMVAPSTAGTISNYVSIDPSTMSDAPTAGPTCVPTTSCAGVVTVVNATAPTSVNPTLAGGGPASTASASAISYALNPGSSDQSTSGTTAMEDEIFLRLWFGLQEVGK